jgi:hypothetical protein
MSEGSDDYLVNNNRTKPEKAIPERQTSRQLLETLATPPAQLQRSYDETPYGKGIVASRLIGKMKDGAYLPKEALIKLQRDFSQPESLREYAKELYQDIALNGENALAHLCLPTRIYRALLRQRMTLRDVREVFDSGDLRYIPHIGTKANALVRDALDAFDVQVDEQQRLQTAARPPDFRPE